MAIIAFGYDRDSIKTGIVHFGVGNFHRAHLEYYLNMLLEDPSQREWGVFGAMILPSDRKLYDALKKDGGIYDLTTCSPSGEKKVYRIGSLKSVCWGIQEPDTIIDRIASPETKIVSLTITEGGYKVDYDSVGTVFWYMAKGLERRMKTGVPITVLSCDNLQHNGDTARNAFSSYFRAKYPEVAVWADENVTYPNSMVDRITPAAVSSKITDVVCEDFIQWVIEDKFAAGRPSLENVGVQFTDDIFPYENMKLSLLNASHSLLCYPAYLEGYRKVDAVVSDWRYHSLIKNFMDIDVSPYVPEPDGVNLEEYKFSLLSRFSNKTISDQVARLCGDGIAKLKVYIAPTLAKILNDKKDSSRFAFLIASYCKYIVKGKTESGEKIEIFEPHITDEDKKIITAGSYMDFLGLSPFKGLELRNNMHFVAKYELFYSNNVAEGLDMLIKNK